MFGVSAVTAAAGTQIALWLVGCFTMNKNVAEAWTFGAPIYWDNTAKQCTIAAGTTPANTKIGVAVAAAANPSSTGNVRLNGVF
jgi:predicted RecA/RadA family phage recombinase